MASSANVEDSSNTSGETSPLLPTSGPSFQGSTTKGDPSLSSYGTNESPQRASSNITTRPSHQNSQLYPYVVILAGLFSLVADFGGSLVDTPEIRLLEMAVCRDYYRTHDPDIIGPPPWSYVPEKHCKIKEIQRDLAYLRATKSLLMTLPGNAIFIRLSPMIG